MGEGLDGGLKWGMVERYPSLGRWVGRGREWGQAL